MKKLKKWKDRILRAVEAFTADDRNELASDDKARMKRAKDKVKPLQKCVDKFITDVASCVDGDKRELVVLLSRAMKIPEAISKVIEDVGTEIGYMKWHDKAKDIYKVVDGISTKFNTANRLLNIYQENPALATGIDYFFGAPASSEDANTSSDK